MTNHSTTGQGRLAGKVAIVAGGGARGGVVGNGQAAAVLFAREGAAVLVADADGERAGRTVGQIEAEGGKASAFVADVTDAGSCAAMVDAAVERYGRLDILHNNVGIGGAGNVVEVDPRRCGIR